MFSTRVIVLSITLSTYVLASAPAPTNTNSTYDHTLSVPSTPMLPTTNLTSPIGATPPTDAAVHPPTTGNSSYSSAPTVPGDTSSGQCMCPVAPTCGAPGSPPNGGPTGYSASPPTDPVSTTSAVGGAPPMDPTGSGHVTSPTPSAPSADMGNGTTSGAPNMPNYVSIASMVAAGAAAFMA